MTKPNLKTKASVFSMGQRSEVLTVDLEAPILVPHALEKTATKVRLRILFVVYFSLPHEWFVKKIIRCIQNYVIQFSVSL